MSLVPLYWTAFGALLNKYLEIAMLTDVAEVWIRSSIDVKEL